jgi:hypothetical protein
MIEFTVLVPTEKEEFFMRLMAELGFPIVPPILPEMQSFDLAEENENMNIQEELLQAEQDIQNGHYLPNEKISELLETWKKRNLTLI